MEQLEATILGTVFRNPENGWSVVTVRSGRNELTVEVSAYNCNNYYIPDQPAFLQAEVVSGGRVLAATGRDFKAYETPRVVKCSRYSFQRAFGEAYRLSPGWKGAELPLSERPQAALLERIARYPDFETHPMKPLRATAVQKRPPAKYRETSWVDRRVDWIKSYPAETLDVNIWRAIQDFRATPQAELGDGPVRVADGSGALLDGGLNDSGFVGMSIVCTKAGRLLLIIDEVLRTGSSIRSATGWPTPSSTTLSPGPTGWSRSSRTPCAISMRSPMAARSRFPRRTCGRTRTLTRRGRR